MIRLTPSFMTLVAVVVLSPLAALGQDVVLTVNVDTNMMTLTNADTVTNVPFDAYSIRSPLGLLNSTGWSSLADQFIPDWNEYGTAGVNLLGETKQVGADVLTSTTTLNFGTGYDPAAGTLAAGFGADIYGDVSVEVYDTMSETLTTGRVEYVGDQIYNTLVLNVDTGTGNVMLENESPSSVMIDAFGIFSTGAALNTAWNGIRDTDANWNEIGTTSASQLGETNPVGPITVASGATFDLGSAFAVGGAEDLTFNFHITASGVGTAGVVKYAGASGLACDLDSDGDCDLDDLDVLYAGNPSQTAINTWLTQASDPSNPYKLASGGTAADMYVLGDVNLNGDVNSSDLGLLLNNFNSAAGVGWRGGDLNADTLVNSGDLGLVLNNFNFMSASAAAVPEPGALPLMMLGVFAVFFLRTRTPRN